MSKPYERIICIDFETRWASKGCDWSGPDGYTLSKMTTEAYIRDPLFKAFGCCAHEVGSGTPTIWITHDKLPYYFATVDWTTTAVLAHNAQFDVGILSLVYGVRPCFVFDTLSMGRALRGVEVGNSLAKLAEDYGLPPKGRAVHSTDGMADIPMHIEIELANYCEHDVALCEQIFGAFMLRVDPVTRLSQGPYPTKELRLIDMTVRMYTDPVLVLDTLMLQDAIKEDKTKMEAALARAGVDEATLASNAHFATALQALGVQPPEKKSKVTSRMAFAFAKNDAMFQQLLNGDDEDVSLLCEARLRVKSTTVRTRAQRFVDIASRGPLPVPLSYYGASTGRWTAAKGSSINMQNLKRGSALRRAIMAPDGYLLCVGDLSQIEPRVLAWLADYHSMLSIFKAGGDPYATFGSTMFNVPGMTKESHPLLRQSAKSAMLGAGYQLGWSSFAGQLLTGFLGAPPVRYIKADAKQLGVTAQDGIEFLDNRDNVQRMKDIAHTCTEEELLVHCLAAKAIIDKFRAAASPVVEFWDLLGTMLTECLLGGREYTHKGVLHFRKHAIEMVNGMEIRYPDMQLERDDKGRPQYTYNDGKKRVKLYPGKICNNVTQGLSRIVMSDGLLRVQKRYRVLGTVHDEGINLVPESDREVAPPWVLAQMITVPKWLPGIPLNADVGIARRYGEAK